MQDNKEREVFNEERVREQSNMGRKGKEVNVERGLKTRYSFWPKQDSEQGERTIRLAQVPGTTQDQYTGSEKKERKPSKK